ncbi:MAG TPA: 30S ribosomal protein S20 [Polyangia bacterium]
MANIKSAQKKNRQRIKREARNRAGKSTVRTAVKRLRAAIAAKDANKATESLLPAVRLLDRAGRAGLLERTATDRSISRLTRAVNALKKA